MSSQSAPLAPDAAPGLAIGALAGLAALKLVMLAGLFTQTPPYPPLDLAPLFASSLALSVFCVAMILVRSRWFAVPAVLVVLESLLSYGPHKLYPGDSLFFAQTAAVYPAIVVGSAPIAVLAAATWRLARAWRVG